VFRCYAFTEMPYPHMPPRDSYDSARITLPNRVFDPEVGNELYRKYYDIYRAADELGLDIMLNEHHATATCLDVAVPISLGILAATTSRSRLLALGNPIANRADPVRIAEELAMVDVISAGRLDAGLVRGTPPEIIANNAYPIRTHERFWDAADLIKRAWTSHDGPFSWESEFFSARKVNIWPRPYQSPHPPIWVATQSVRSIAPIAERGYNMATILCGSQTAASLFDSYRSSYESAFGEAAPVERLGYCALMYVANSRETAMEGARKLHWYLRNNKLASQFRNPPGYLPPEARVNGLRSQVRQEYIDTAVSRMRLSDVEDLVGDGMMFVGTPDDVHAQLVEFYRSVGGFGNLLAMVHAGTMSYRTVFESMRLLATEVIPRFRAELLADSLTEQTGGARPLIGLG
jgi:alkanesulfonate monooxygenase SsuD/methylene tetrahydromethanopterin reductase-like flavin-dependent oxidoreductase (luciferase family)